MEKSTHNNSLIATSSSPAATMPQEGTLSLYMSDTDSLPLDESCKIRVIEIQFCKNITSLDLTMFKYLEILKIISAGFLSEVKISGLSRLRELTIHNCHSLETVNISGLRALKVTSSTNDFSEATKICK